VSFFLLWPIFRGLPFRRNFRFGIVLRMKSPGCPPFGALFSAPEPFVS
jgi:hypothetical protein